MNSINKTARVAGFAYLVTFAIVVLTNFGINERLAVSGNAIETARNILAHETLFRLGIAADLIYCAGLVVLLTALYVILKPVNRNLALFAAFWRLVYGLMWVLVAINCFFFLQLLSGAGYLEPVGTNQLQALGKLYLSVRVDMYYVGLLFYGLASTVCSYLLFKSRYIPRVLAAFGVISSLWCVICALAFIMFPNFTNVVDVWWFDSPMAIFEVVTGFRLLIKGIHEEKWKEQESVANAL